MTKPIRRNALPPQNAGPGETGCEWTGELFGEDRVRCCVPYCNRTIERARLAPHTEWICGKHWSAIPPQQRLRYANLKRTARQALKRGRSSYPAIIERVHRTWQRLKDRAAEIAGGI